MTNLDPSFDHMLDAIAWTKASLLGDVDGRTVIATNTDPAGLVDALTAMVCHHLMMATDDPLGFLDAMGQQLSAEREASR